MSVLPGTSGVLLRKMAYVVPTKLLVVLVRWVTSPFWVEAELFFVPGWWVDEPLVGFVGLFELTLLIVIMAFPLLTPRSPQLCSFGGD